MTNAFTNITDAVADIKRLTSACKTDDQRLAVAKFGLCVLLRSPQDLLGLLVERPQWLEALGLRIVPTAKADLAIDELIQLRGA